MKKILTVMSIITLVGVVTLQSANANRGLYGRNPGDCPQRGGYQHESVTNNAEKFNVFRQDTTELRRALMSKKAEFNALMISTNPDPGKAGRLSGELFDLREQLRAKAKENNLTIPLGRGGMGMMGFGRGECFGPKV